MNASNKTIQVYSQTEFGGYNHADRDPWHRLYSIKLGTIFVALGITTAIYCAICLLYRCYNIWIKCGLAPGSMVRNFSPRPFQNSRNSRTEIIEEIKIPQLPRKA